MAKLRVHFSEVTQMTPNRNILGERSENGNLCQIRLKRRLNARIYDPTEEMMNDD